MLESEIKLAICKVNCGDESGTGWLIGSNHVITAYHCVENALENKCPIKLGFNFQENSEQLIAEIIDYDEDLDICLLSLDTISSHSPIKFNSAYPIGGKNFYSYGWPVNKLEMGHRLEGSIAQILYTPKLGNDIELQIDSPTTLKSYKGLSGAPIICDGVCVGLIRYSIESTIGAISILRVREFLRKNNILEDEPDEVDLEINELAPRPDFNTTFEEVIISHSGEYVFLEGAHGIGKSTFCNTYRPEHTSIEYFNTYSFTHNKDFINVAHLAQPIEFVNWLNMQVSLLLTGRTGVVLKNDYPKLIKETQDLLRSLGSYYNSKNKIGVFFIDGIDEIEKHDRELFVQFIGLLPQAVSSSLVIVISAPSYTKFSSILGTRLKNESCISLPLLTYEVSQQFCRAILIAERYNPVTIKTICDRAQGHPLYLRYLIDLVNFGRSDKDIVELPLLEGNILNYYESVWSQLSGDMEGVNLLAIIARLRWGIPISLLVEILNPNEQSVLVSTIERIKHLLLTPDHTTIYHSSFSDFIKEKTHLRENDIQLRLFKFCENHFSNEYGLFNIIYHGLKSFDCDKSYVISYCNQNWADECALKGIKPDKLLGDISEVLKAVIELGSFTETIRILLLSQRMQFRYDILFAQSAELTANALIALNRSGEVLQHVVRYGQLIIPINLALKISMRLIEVHNYKEAQILLNIIDVTISNELEELYKNGLEPKVFFSLYELQLNQYILKALSGDKNANQALLEFQTLGMEVVKYCAKDEESSKFIRIDMMMRLQAAKMALGHSYLRIDQLKKKYQGSIKDFLEPYFNLASYYLELCKKYEVKFNKLLLKNFISDLDNLISEVAPHSIKFSIYIVNDLISLGVTSTTLISIAKQNFNTLNSLQFIADDNVSLNESGLNEAITQWRVKAYLNPDLPKPNIIPLRLHWLNGIESLIENIAWCDGMARRFKEENNLDGLNSIWDEIQQNIFEKLKFSLAERINWRDAYALPEAILPHIYKYLSSLILDIFPAHIEQFLGLISDRFSYQCGIYSEGFRAILNNVVNEMAQYELEDDVEDIVFNLLERWENFVFLNLKNRHELIPELLTIIPLYKRLGALEKAEETYKNVLAFSMGPNWYKEDQLGLAASTLGSIDPKTCLQQVTLSKIAGLLEVSSGEMTFERFVRYAKRDFIKALCLRGDFDKAILYYIRQTYGSLEQMYADITKGEIDRLTELKGTRFPGGALDEQDAILCIVKSAIPYIDWQFCWVILETFHFGDWRHLSNYAEIYGLLIQKNQADAETIKMMFSRLEIICESEMRKDERTEFLTSLKKYIPESIKDTFQNQFVSYLESLTPILQETSKVPINPIAKESKAKSTKQDTIDSLYSPGVFGTSDSLSQAEEFFSNANRYMRRRNYSLAQQEVISALQAFQDGGWSIWDGQIPEMKRGQNLLKEISHVNSDLIKLFKPLIVNERYSYYWVIAENLISWLASSSSITEQNELLRLSIEHIQLMVGLADNEIADYKFLEDSHISSILSCFVKLILHVVDHPTWLRSEKAADMLMWLLRNYPKYIHLFGNQAFSNDSGNHPDVICGILDQLSYSESKLWEKLSTSLDFQAIKQECKHTGRLSVLKRILKQAAQNGDEQATSILAELREHSSQVILPSETSEAECPKWAMGLKYEWSKLKALGLTNSDLVERSTSIMQDICSPFALDTCLEIEELLSQGYYLKRDNPIRWLAKARYALQVSLGAIVPSNQHEKINEIFRIYNPTRLDHLRIKNFNSHGEAWLTSPPKPLSNGNIYLDYYETFWYEGEIREVRLTAYLGDISQKLVSSGRFSSKENPNLKNTSYTDICANVAPALVYFCTYTPAIPTSHFVQILGIDPKSLKRAWWRSSRSDEEIVGVPQSQGCYLSIHEDELLKLPNEMNIFWIFEIDRTPVGQISLK
ncbi:AVAST type 1 anti-phage system protease Avs1b [Acinetobacter pittii]|uniref:AVAST type 1 anti-phage system protease Avs1b n=1 Tax=Acinetobacter pittii TaxID=48296 RepID=UPI001952025B|nr:AVAST type 1 anti-phage system protease Avs1b [Acinetobacter pittii]QRQ11510.1 serine protease [Acinetobacter pittii]